MAITVAPRQFAPGDYGGTQKQQMLSQMLMQGLGMAQQQGQFQQQQALQEKQGEADIDFKQAQMKKWLAMPIEKQRKELFDASRKMLDGLKNNAEEKATPDSWNAYLFGLERVKQHEAGIPDNEANVKLIQMEMDIAKKRRVTPEAHKKSQADALAAVRNKAQAQAEGTAAGTPAKAPSLVTDSAGKLAPKVEGLQVEPTLDEKAAEAERLAASRKRGEVSETPEKPEKPISPSALNAYETLTNKVQGEIDSLETALKKKRGDKKAGALLFGTSKGAELDILQGLSEEDIQRRIDENKKLLKIYKKSQKEAILTPQAKALLADWKTRSKEEKEMLLANPMFIEAMTKNGLMELLK